MEQDQTFRVALITGIAIVFPVMVYFRIRSQATGEKLDRWQEGAFILFTLRPLGAAAIGGLITFTVNPRSMAWSSLALPAWLRWCGIGLNVLDPYRPYAERTGRFLPKFGGGGAIR